MKIFSHQRFLDADLAVEGPIVLQLGGSDPEQMNIAAKLAFDYGYREININCGCPSEKVAGAGCFGAALMLQANPQTIVLLLISILFNIIVSYVASSAAGGRASSSCF
jgi:tRNA-dihydrouridine synthase